jgi:hypothetical protein
VCGVVVTESALVGFHRCNQIKGEEMKQNIFLTLFGFALLFGSVTSSQAQVKQIEMHIAGYLCGN